MPFLWILLALSAQPGLHVRSSSKPKQLHVKQRNASQKIIILLYIYFNLKRHKQQKHLPFQTTASRKKTKKKTTKTTKTSLALPPCASARGVALNARRPDLSTIFSTSLLAPNRFSLKPAKPGQGFIQLDDNALENKNLPSPPLLAIIILQEAIRSCCCLGAAPQTRPDPATAMFKATDFDSLLENDFTALDPAAQPKRVAAISD
jgi:hypothetical protein